MLIIRDIMPFICSFVLTNTPDDLIAFKQIDIPDDLVAFNHHLFIQF